MLLRARLLPWIVLTLIGLAFASCQIPLPAREAILTWLPSGHTVTPTLTATRVPTTAPTLTATASSTLRPTATGTATATVLPTETPLPTETATPTPSVTATPTWTPSPTPGPTPDGTLRSARVPILMYHYLSEPPEDADIYRLDLSVRPEQFAAHLDRIQALGYTTIDLDLLVQHLTREQPLPPQPLIITFDDGYRDNYENAFPLLQARGMTATFFVVTDFIDAQRPEYLTWEMVREMHAAGMTIGSHGRNHVSLRRQDHDYLVWQALGSLETIEYEIGERPRFISYPGGRYDELTIAIFHSANYWAGLTTQQGATHTNQNLFELTRVRIHGTTTANDLAQLLALDW